MTAKEKKSSIKIFAVSPKKRDETHPGTSHLTFPQKPEIRRSHADDCYF